MATCAACGATMFGGVRDGDRRYCNQACRKNDVVGQVAAHVPNGTVDEVAAKIHAGPCPHCQGAGPVDVRTSHQVLSFLVMTRWSSKHHVACRSCGWKKQAAALAISAVGGWWGFPWGLIFTPVQIGRNVVGMFGGPDPAAPSASLREHARVLIARQLSQQVPPPMSGPRGFDVIPPPPLPVAQVAEPVATAVQR